MYDIKDIIEVDNDYSNLKKYFFGFLMLFSLGFLIYELIMMRKNRKPEVIVFKTPIEKATALINQLDAKQLFQKGEIKEYYSELTDIARNYIEEEINVPAMESTTSELIYALQKASKHKKLRLSKETLKNLEKVLKQADLVKFAKSKPQENQITDDRNRILDSIVTIHKSIPIVKPEENNSELNKIELEKLAKAKKSKKIKTAVIVAISILIISIVTLTFTKGFTYLKDTVFGSQTKELFEGEWIYSQYGNPAIKIETPQVLKRTDVSAALPKESSALIKEMQTFVSGSLVGNFYVSVSTLKMKEKTEVDLNAALDSSISFMEAQGAQNILVKPEDFSTPNGMKGIRGQGTLMLINPLTKGKTKMQYQTLIFNQENGLQQVVIMFEDKDEYGEKIAERVFNSVELQQKTQ